MRKIKEQLCFLECPRLDIKISFPAKMTKKDIQDFERWVQTAVLPHFEFCIEDEEPKEETQ